MRRKNIANVAGVPRDKLPVSHSQQLILDGLNPQCASPDWERR